MAIPFIHAMVLLTVSTPTQATDKAKIVSVTVDARGTPHQTNDVSSVSDVDTASPHQMLKRAGRVQHIRSEGTVSSQTTYLNSVPDGPREGHSLYTQPAAGGPQKWCDASWVRERFQCALDVSKNTIDQVAANSDTPLNKIVGDFEDNLFKCIEGVIEGSLLHASPDWQQAATKWDLAFGTALNKEPISTAITEFKQTAQTSVLFTILEVLIENALKEVKGFEPKLSSGEDVADIKNQVVKYLTAMDEGIEGIESGFTQVTESETYDLLGTWSDIMKKLIPQQCNGATLVQTIVGGLDDLISLIIGNVDKYTKAIAGAKFCWRTPMNKQRPWSRPNVCKSGYEFVFAQGCLKTSGLLQQADGSLAGKGPDSSVDGKGNPKAWECQPPLCKTAACPQDKKQGMLGAAVVCFGACAPLYKTKPDSEGTCSFECRGKFPYASGMMCFENPGAAKAAIINMAQSTLASFGNIFTMIKGLMTETDKNGMISKDSLSKTFSAFADIGVPFAAPSCTTALAPEQR